MHGKHALLRSVLLGHSRFAVSQALGFALAIAGHGQPKPVATTCNATDKPQYYEDDTFKLSSLLGRSVETITVALVLAVIVVGQRTPGQEASASRVANNHSQISQAIVPSEGATAENLTSVADLTPDVAPAPIAIASIAGAPTIPEDTSYRVYFPLVQFGDPITPTYRVYLPFVQVGERQAPVSVITPAPTATPTPAPMATPTPTPTPITPLASPNEIVRAIQRQQPRSIDKQSKIGIGVYADGGGYALNELLKVRPGVVVLMDPKPEFAREVRRQLPKAFIFGRRFVQYQPLDNPESRGAAFADYVAELAVPLRGIVDGWMSYNEPVGRGDIAGFQAYNTFQVAFAKRLQGTYGIGAVAGNDPPGAVDINEYPKYFGEAIRISKFFGIHAYSSPEGTSLREPEAPWYALRYRKIHQALQNAGIKSGPIVLTEVGVAKGWRQMGQNTEAVTADFAWLADETAKDDYMLGFAIFGVFSGSGWESFDLGGTSVLDLIGRYDPTHSPLTSPTPTTAPH